MPSYRQKPIIVRAEQFFPNHDPLPEGVIETPNPVFRCIFFHVQTPTGLAEIKAGDWVVTSEAGARYICKPESFAATYEPVEDAEAAPAIPSRPLRPDDEVMPRKEFCERVRQRLFTSCDGFADLATATSVSAQRVWPHEIATFEWPSWATHVVFYRF